MVDGSVLLCKNMDKRKNRFKYSIKIYDLQIKLKIRYFVCGSKKIDILCISFNSGSLNYVIKYLNETKHTCMCLK